MSEPTVRDSTQAIYHVVVKANGSEPLFLTERGKGEFLRAITSGKVSLGYKLLAYALLDGQAHFLIMATGSVIKSLVDNLVSGQGRAFGSNQLANAHLAPANVSVRIGHNDARVLPLLRYVHYLPVIHGYSHHVNLSRWTSHFSYLTNKDPGGVDLDVFYLLLGQNDTPERGYQRLMSVPHSAGYLEQAYQPLMPESSEINEKTTIAYPPVSLEELSEFVQTSTGIHIEIMRSKSRNERVVAARRKFIAVAVILYSHPVSEVSKFLNVHHSYVSRLTHPNSSLSQETVDTAQQMALSLGVNH